MSMFARLRASCSLVISLVYAGQKLSGTPGRFRNRIVSIAMSYRQLPAASARRGLPSIGFSIDTPSDVELTPVGGGDTVVRCSERRADGKPVGELEVAVFQAALVIDRDGILEDKVQGAANDVAEQGARVLAPIPVSLPGASGFRADVELHSRVSLPYVYVFAIAPHDLGVDGGVLVTVRCAAPEWAAADAILRSLRILTRHARSANDAGDAPPVFPLLARRADD